MIRHLRQHGCTLIREGGNHSWWGNPQNNRRSSVPRHSEVKDHLARKICRDLGIPEP
ncbi:MAG: type II toxin-antitoxin system HicA family toxin [Gemmataceae bacterium]|nr:type II toxin-antitoxin system HicA family toxin [Gemmataceae bacterium]